MSKQYYKIHLINKDENLNQTIKCSSEDYILDIAEKENILLPYSCRAGSCSTCVGKLIKGVIDQSDQTFLDSEQIANGYILTCIAKPLSDCIILTSREEELY